MPPHTVDFGDSALVSEAGIHHDHLASFKRLCTSCYFHNDPTARAILHAFECYEIVDNGVRLSIEHKSTRSLSIRLEEIGVYNDMLLHPADLPKYLSIKNETRQEYHSFQEQRQFEELHMAIEHAMNRQRVASVANPDGMKYIPTSAAKRQEHVQTFIARHEPNIGTHPFILGLKAALSRQLHSKRAICWSFDVAVLTQSGDEFMHSAVRLLIDVLSFVTDDSSKLHVGGERAWFAPVWIADSELRALLKLFPADQKLLGRATGLISETEKMRLAAAVSSDRFSDILKGQVLSAKRGLFSHPCFRL